jgi:transcriptional regulator of acetoin/glycerol metabolism
MLELARDRATRDYLMALMKHVQGNVTQAAERAGVERESMHRLLGRQGSARTTTSPVRERARTSSLPR